MRMRKRAEIQKRDAKVAGNPTTTTPTNSHTTPIPQTYASHSPDDLTAWLACLTAPEVVQDPSYVNNALIRQDIRETFLCGGWYTDTNGMVEMTTIYPDYLDGRTPHVNIMVHKAWTEAGNGFVHTVRSILADSTKLELRHI